MLTSSTRPVPRPSLSLSNLPAAATRPSPPCLFPRKWHFMVSFGASSSAAAAAPAPGVNLQPLESALAKKDSNAVKEALDQLREVGWAKRWSSQPYVSRRTVSHLTRFRVLYTYIYL
uniref:Uncharacterized protein LOC105123871 isoform X2 n=1 Tax=Rhizophora mucronata TaxID=61149 RepID=A0A2P2LAY8_RHIMU